MLCLAIFNIDNLISPHTQINFDGDYGALAQFPGHSNLKFNDQPTLLESGVLK